MKLHNFIFFLIPLFLNSCSSVKNSQIISGQNELPAITESDVSIENIVNSMTIEEKVAQLFIIRPEQLDPSISQEEMHKNDSPHTTEISTAFCENYKKYPVCGFTIFNCNIKSPKQLKTFNQNIHQLSETTSLKIRPLICIDEEGGKISRLASLKNFSLPEFAPMGTLTNNKMTFSQREEIYKNAGKTIGRYLKEYEIDVDFAPVFDVNTNPANPVIGTRAFSSNPKITGRLAIQFLYGLRENGIEGCLKHFPGHGDTSTDTHLNFSKIDKTKEQLFKCELLPFKYGIKNNASLIMTAHISIPNVTGDFMPASLSYKIQTELLRNELHFSGLIITDALEMGAIEKLYDSGTAAVMALLAGADILLIPYDFYMAYNTVVDAVKTNIIPESRINQSLFRILYFKQKQKFLEMNAPLSNIKNPS